MKRSLFSYEPDTYRKSEVMQNILKPQEEQLIKAEERQDSVIEDMYPSKTVHPELWESEYAIKPTESIDHRRKNIVAKIRGAGTITKDAIRDIVKAYTEGEVYVSEDADDSLICIDIKSEEIYTEQNDYTNRLYEVIPAHMDFFTRQTVMHEPHEKLHYGSAMDTVETIEITQGGDNGKL